MIRWDDFEHIHVIKKLKHILSSWWNIDVVFTEENGYVRGFNAGEASLNNAAVNFFLQKESGREMLAEAVNKAINELRQTDKKYIVTKFDMTGFDVAVFPIIIDNDFLGTSVAMGFFHDTGNIEERYKEVRERMAAFGADAAMIEKAIPAIRNLKDSEKEHFCEIVDLVSQEVVTLHLEISARDDRIHQLNKELGGRYKYDSMIGKSKPMQELYSLLDKIKATESTCLIQGENGTGKELIAKAIHYNSPRKTKQLIVQNCSAFNDNLLESELFGHAKGSFTGAIKDKKGLFEIADGGTLFLDEIGDTSPTMQVKLLRVLQEGTFIPVGSTEPRRVDVRIIAATNRDLKKMIEDNSFREDLYYRLNVINIKVPSLKERKEDIPLLIEHFLETSSKTNNAGRKTLTSKAMEKLYDYAWPGNIRELQNEIERLVVLAGTDSKMGPEMLSTRIVEMGEKSKVQGSRVHGKLKDALEELEKQMILEGLRRTGWNKSKLAKELGISRAGLIMKVDKYDLDKRKNAR